MFDRKTYDRERYYRLRDSIAKARVARYKERKEWLENYKSKLKCNRCPENHISCLHFHHLNPREKETNIANAFKMGWSIERMTKEIEKCEVLCANCHCKLHYEERKAKQELAHSVER